MKFNSLLLLATSLLFVDIAPSVSVPTPAIAQLETRSSATETLAMATENTFQNCQRTVPAVVTIYAGREIGSGSIVSADGLVITNHHVVKQVVQSGGARPLFVKVASGERFSGQLLGIDRKNDLALVKMNAPGQLPTVPFASNDAVQSGQPVCAIGSPYGRAGSLSQGTLSLVRRNGDLQSNVRLFPGNSGGPLLNARGEMIGINKAILESPAGKNTGISFATNLAAARQFVEQTANRTLPDTSASTIAQAPLPAPQPAISQFPSVDRGRLGVIVDTQNLMVRQVEYGSPAATGGIRPGDRLLAVNGMLLDDLAQLQRFLNQRPGSAIFTIRREQEVSRVQVNF